MKILRSSRLVSSSWLVMSWWRASEGANGSQTFPLQLYLAVMLDLSPSMYEVLQFFSPNIAGKVTRWGYSERFDTNSSNIKENNENNSNHNQQYQVFLMAISTENHVAFES